MKELEKLINSLSNYWGISPEKVVDRLNSMDESEIKKLVNKMTNKFKDGGFIDCLRNGGSIAKCKCGCDKIAKAAGGMSTDGNWKDYHTIINAPGDTLRFKQYFSGPTTMQTHPEGGVTYTKSTVDGISHMYGGGYQPNMWEKIVLRMSPVDAETEQNWQQLIENHKNDPAVKDKTQKKQFGGQMRPLYRQMASVAPRMGIGEVNEGYDIYKSMGKSNGLRGRQLRQFAKNNTMRDINNLPNTADFHAFDNEPVSSSWVQSRNNTMDFAMGQGLSRGQARMAYQNQKRALRNTGLRGSELRNQARVNIVNSLT